MQRSIKSQSATLVLAAITIFTAMLSGCSAVSSSGPSASPGNCGTIGFVVLNQTQAIFISQATAAKKWADDHGCKILVGNPNNDPLTQANIVDGWIQTQQISALMVGPINIEALKPSLTKAAEASIPTIVLYGLDKPLAARQAIVVINWIQYGQNAGQALADCINKKFTGKGVVAVLDGPELPGDIVTGRINGEIAKLKELVPQANVVARQNGQGQRLPSQNVMSALLLKDPTINSVTGTNDDSMIGVVNAIKAAGKDPTQFCIVGLDATDEGLAMVNSGQFYATVDLQPIKQVTDGLDVLADMMQNKIPALAPDFIMHINTHIVTGS